LGGRSAGGAFGQRGPGARRRLLRAGGGSTETESAVESALRWLAEHQEADGHWDTAKHGAAGLPGATDTACAGFAVLAFLGAGHTERVGKYKNNVCRAVRRLISRQQPNGCLDAASAYCGYAHAVAGMALAEAAGMGRLPETKAAAQKAVNYSVNLHQDPASGGWRYGPKQSGDTSVTGWFIMQLKSAKAAGLTVEAAAFQRAEKFLNAAEVEAKNAPGADAAYGRAHRYAYIPVRGQNGGFAGAATPLLTAVGCLCRQFMGTSKEELANAVEWFVKTGGVPEWSSARRVVGASRQVFHGQSSSVNLYYWYYGTLCTFQQGGELWAQWNKAMKAALCGNQDKNGSWAPIGAFGGSWGRVGQTALGALCLEVYYRYLPMYR
jgi:hypothetical protein